MRKSLYYKDDDVRLSLLHGNYVTLTNLSQKDIARIIKYRISPINVSIHTLDPKLREYMIGRKDEYSFLYLKKLAKAGIRFNCQIVCCPGVNDGWELSKTIEGLMQLGRSIRSVSVVPVGLTKHRQGLAVLDAFDKNLAVQTVRQVEYYGEKCLKKRGRRVFFCADELYMLAGIKLPARRFYEDYPQLENGVGMMRLFISEFVKSANAALKAMKTTDKECRGDRPRSPVLSEKSRKVILVTGTLAAPYLTKLLQDFMLKYGRMNELGTSVIAKRYNRCGNPDTNAPVNKSSGSPRFALPRKRGITDDGRESNIFIHPITNNFFGDSVTVSGLITGQDIIAQLKVIEPGCILLIPQNMLRHGENVFLDDITVAEVAEALRAEIKVVKQNGAELFNVLQSIIK